MKPFTDPTIQIPTSLVTLFALLVPSLVSPTPAQAAPTITSDGSPGTAYPHAAMGPYTMLPFPDDTGLKLPITGQCPIPWLGCETLISTSTTPPWSNRCG